MEPEIVTLAERPDLMEVFWDMDTSWPEFMKHDPIGNSYYSCLEEYFTECVLMALDDSGRIVAKAFSAPFTLPEGDLPDAGWDFALRSAVLTRARGGSPNAITAAEIAVEPGRQGTGLSAVMLAALRDNAGRLGYRELLAPVRPNGRTDVREPMEAYAFRTRDDGLPVDPWLRVHVRAGGRIDRVARRSMCIPGTLEEWREWTGLPFDTTGPVVVPGALVPVLCDAEHGTATYVEPNVWVRHATGA
ncbi:GNAT superfamily N-acetyltransferase [Nocardioides cavernae]|uniref:GNAT superfamily N-acetyltransferase n=1 Tax=Nocardioides cavernae TaxID=1921566 RepID=A0A7Y9KS33_9ACTN|nr:N-acetyltransferase [Nocardioides cavernae]NYE37199.1 GNAT superfamily N-acetyltransferase [Nocardioides cavernae]